MAINPQGNTYCSKCRTKIASGKNYCYAHYQEALVDYRRELQEYSTRKQEWARLDEEERQLADANADESSTTFFAAGGGAILGAALWYFLSKTWSIDGYLAY